MQSIRLLLAACLFWLAAAAPAQLAGQCNAPAPGNFKSSPISNTSTVLSWNQVAAYTAYRLTVIDTGSNQIILNNVLVNGTSRTVTGLNSNTGYQATVKVQCSTGNTSPNAATMYFTLCLLPAPSNFNGVVLPGPEVLWTWDSVPGAMSYLLTVTDMNTGVVQTFTTPSTAQAMGAILGHTYTATVQAICPNNSVSPKGATRTVKIVIIEDIVQFGGCGTEDGTCNLTHNATIHYLAADNFPVSRQATLLPKEVISFAAGQYRRVYKVKIWEGTAATSPSPTNSIEGKLAFEPNNPVVKFIKTAACSTCSLVANATQDGLIFSKGAKKGQIRFSNYVSNSTQASFEAEISKDYDFGLNIQIFPCRNCTFAPMPGGGEDGEAQAWEAIEPRNANLPEATSLSAHPNPAKGNSTLSFGLAEEQTLSISLFDATGKLIRQPIRDEWHEAGFHEIELDLSGLPPGVYQCALNSEKGAHKCSVVKL